MTVKVFSFGGGVQSTAVLVLAAQGTIDYKTFLFCNVGADSEHPDTLSYIQQVAFPYAQEHGLDLVELQKVKRDGSIDTIYQRLTRPESRSIGIPVRMSSGAPGRRSCTMDFKIRVCDKWLKHHNAQREGAIVGLGISWDEMQRMRRESGEPWKTLAYPLIDLRLDRVQCQELIRRAGLPVPPKSSCWFCPYHSLRHWQEMRHQHKDLFEKSVALEQLINERRVMLGKDRVWFTDKLKPLDKVTTEYVQPSLFDDEGPCESGYCWT